MESTNGQDLVLGSVILHQKLALKAQALETPLIGGGI